MRTFSTLLFLIPTLTLALAGCATPQPHNIPTMFSQPRNSDMSDEQAESFFEDVPRQADVFVTKDAAVQWRLQPTPPNLR